MPTFKTRFDLLVENFEARLEVAAADGFWVVRRLFEREDRRIDQMRNLYSDLSPDEIDYDRWLRRRFDKYKIRNRDCDLRIEKPLILDSYYADQSDKISKYQKYLHEIEGFKWNYEVLPSQNDESAFEIHFHTDPEDELIKMAILAS